MTVEPIAVPHTSEMLRLRVLVLSNGHRQIAGAKYAELVRSARKRRKGNL